MTDELPPLPLPAYEAYYYSADQVALAFARAIERAHGIAAAGYRT